MSLDLSKDLYYSSEEGQEELADIYRRFNGRILNAEFACQHFKLGNDWYFECVNHMRILYTLHPHLESFIFYECDDDGGHADDFPPNHRVVECGLGETILRSTEELCCILVTILRNVLHQINYERPELPASFSRAQLLEVWGNSMLGTRWKLQKDLLQVVKCD